MSNICGNLSRIPDDIVVHAMSCLNGEISCFIRAVSIRYTFKSVTFRYYVEREPDDEEREDAEIVLINFDSGHAPKLESGDIEFFVTEEPIGNLDPLDFMLYARKERKEARADR